MIEEQLSTEEFNKLKAKKERQELMTVLNSIASSVAKDDDSEIVQLLLKNNNSIDAVAEILEQIKDKKQEINIETNQAQVVKSIGELAVQIKSNEAEILKYLTKEQPLREWDFQVIRTSYGVIERVYAKQIK